MAGYEGHVNKRQRTDGDGSYDNNNFNQNNNNKNNNNRFDDKLSPNHILFMTVQNPSYPITCDILNKICSPNGRVLRIVIFKKVGVQAMVEFDSVESATRTKDKLSGKDIYSGCCSLKIEYAKVTDNLKVHKNDDESWDYTLAGEDTSRPGLLQQPGSVYSTNAASSGGNNMYGNQMGGQMGGMLTAPMGGQMQGGMGGPMGGGMMQGGMQGGMGGMGGPNQMGGQMMGGMQGPMQGGMGVPQMVGYNNGGMGAMGYSMGGQGQMQNTGYGMDAAYRNYGMGMGAGDPSMTGYGAGGGGGAGGNEGFQNRSYGGDSAYSTSNYDNSGNSEDGRPGCVLMIYGIGQEIMNCDKIFNLFCLYGNVFRVKFLKSKEGCAMVQMGDPEGAQRVLNNLNGVEFFGRKMSLGPSKHLELQDVLQPFDLSDGTPSYKEYIGIRNNRFANADAARKNRIQAPTKVLHFFNAPPDISMEEIANIFSRAEAPEPVQIKSFPSKNDKSSSGILEFNSVLDATEAVIKCNHSSVKLEGGKFPYTFKLCFSSANFRRD